MAKEKVTKKKPVAKKPAKITEKHKQNKKRASKKDKFLDSVPKPVDEKSEIMHQRINDIILERTKVQRECKAIHVQTFSRKNYNIKWIAFGDTHFFLQNDDLLGQMIQDHGDADFAVHGGDVMDMNIVSLWPKEKYYSLEAEYRVAAEYFQKFASTWRNLYVISGNHCSRLAKMITASMDPSVRFATHYDLLGSLCDGYDLNKDGILVPTHDFSNVHYQRGVDNWLIRIGRAVVFHHSGNRGMNSMTASGQGVIAAKNWLNGRKAAADLYVQFHTHRQSKVLKGGELLMEPGATCLPMDYGSKPKSSLNGCSYGFMVGYMANDGAIDFDRTENVYYGSDALTKDVIDPTIAAKDNRPKKKKIKRK